MYSKIGSPTGSSNKLKHRPVPPIRNSLNEKKRSREELKAKLKEYALISESGTASVIEVIEPTSSEEEEFRKSMQEMNLSWARGIANNSNSNNNRSSVTAALTNSSPSRSKPPSPSRRAYANGDVSPTKRLLEMGISPRTLRDEGNDDLVEVDQNGLRSGPSSLGNVMNRSPNLGLIPDSEEEEEGSSEKSGGKKTGGFFQKIAAKTKWKKRGIRKEPAGKEADEESNKSEELTKAEEHVLPDSFEDDHILNSNTGDELEGGHTLTISLTDNNKDPGNNNHINNSKILDFRRLSADGGSMSMDSGSSSQNNRKSLSPSSRKSLFGSKTTMLTEAVSVTTSEDSGIVLQRPHSSASRPDSRPNSASSRMPPAANDPEPSSPLQNGQDYFKLGKIEEVSVSSTSRCSSAVQENMNSSSLMADRKSLNNVVNPLSLLRKKSLECKAWYDVPSDEDREIVDEEVSLASIISTRASSEEE